MFCANNVSFLHMLSYQTTWQKLLVTVLTLPQSTARNAYILAQRPLHVLPAAGFHLMKLTTVIEYFAAIVAQVSLPATRWNLLQLFVMPSWYGVGVVTPLPGFVVVVGAFVVVESACPTV